MRGCRGEENLRARVEDPTPPHSRGGSILGFLKESLEGSRLAVLATCTEDSGKHSNPLIAGKVVGNPQSIPPTRRRISLRTRSKISLSPAEKHLLRGGLMPSTDELVALQAGAKLGERHFLGVGTAVQVAKASSLINNEELASHFAIEA